MPADPPHAPGRVLLKLSGELLAGRSGCGLDTPSLEAYAGALVECAGRGWRMGVVVGGGNFVRGGRSQGITRHRADWMGMLATVINALALQDAIERLGGRAAVLSAFPVADQVAGFSPEAASGLLDSGSTVIYAGGTGNPFLTTDTAAALRAVQTGCRLLLKGTKVDGIYDSDPVGNPSAKRFERMTYDEVLGLGLGVMDAAAVAVCRDSSLPLLVFDVTDPANILRALGDERLGTTVREEP